MATKWTVKRMVDFGSPKRWGVFRDGELVEGGFFSKLAALDALYKWQRSREEEFGS